MQTLLVTVDEKPLEFELARAKAETAVAGVLDSPLLIAWYDGLRQEGHPDVPECQHQPGWLAYAEGHGGKIRVDINEGVFSFIYTNAEG